MLSMRVVAPAAVAAAMAVIALHVAAAETPQATDAEQLYRQLRRSDDRSAQLLGERWYGLVRRQEWTDASGKFTTTAKYLEHDPDLKWVKLRAERTVDGRREVKDLTVPLDKLSKTCQSRVYQINHLEQRVREAAAGAEQQARAAEQERQQQEAMGEGPDAGRGEGRGGPMDEMGRQEPPARGGRVTPQDAGPSPSAVAWRTSYEAFRANFTVQEAGRGQYRVDWGTLKTLQQVHDSMQSHAQSGSVPGPMETVGLAAQLASMGEFVWDTKLTKPVADDLKWADRLDLPPLPEPLALELVLDRDSGNWQRFQVGDRVRLAGRFIAFAGENKIVAAIRFPGSEPAAGR